MEDFHLDTYLQKINLPPSELLQDPLQLLKIVTYYHVLAFPYQNYNLWTQNFKPIEERVVATLSVGDLFSHMVVNGTKYNTGYCYQNAELFYTALVALGFDVRKFSARVIKSFKKEYYSVENHVVNLLSHAVLCVTIEGEEYLVDGGFGFSSPRYPLLHQEGEQIQDDGEEYYLERTNVYDDGKEWLEVAQRVKGEWFILYHLLVETRSKEDVEEEHQQLFLSPTVVNIRDKFLLVGKVTPTERISLMYFTGEDHFIHKTMYSDGTPSVTKELTTWDVVVSHALDEFGVTFPDDAEQFFRLVNK